jgi:two-component system, OmpR family, sensor histidine kinase KdpD
MTRGTLRLYLGYAAGVGKTYAMLNEGRRRRDRGTDVVVGFVEPHGRSRTSDQMGDLEVLPRCHFDRRTGVVEEMDVEAILARHPEVALVDELAHPNEPGSRNQARWQDVEELLERGIDVVSTLNIQHIESLNDVIHDITGVRERATVPDEVVRRADQQELVDMTPQALRRRMAHGNVYPPEKIDAALSNTFREGNLGALRELALLWLVDRVDESLQTYRKVHGIEGSWGTRERILVAVAGRPDDEAVMRRAARMATRRGGELLAVHVIPENGPDVGAELGRSRVLVEQLGGSFRQVLGRSIPDALLDVARSENVTQVVLGSGSRSRWRELLRGSVVNRLLRDSGPIDVHVISSESPPSNVPMRAPRHSGLPASRRLGAVALTGVGLPLLTAALVGVRGTLGLPGALLIYLTFVVMVAAVGGLWPAVVAAVAASLLLNWFFTPPLHTWSIANADNLLHIVVFVAVAAVVSVLVDRVARARTEAQRGRAEAEALARMAGWLVSEDDPVPALVEHLRTTFGMDAVAVLTRTADGGWTVEAAAGEGITTPLDGTQSIELGSGSALVLRGSHVPSEANRVLVAFAAQLAAAVRGRELAKEAAGAAELAEVNELRTAILAAVSHDLRTPLASVKAAVSSLRQPDMRWTPQETAEFLATIEEESDRLNNLVGNLLDMSRIQTGALAMVRGPIGLDEVVPRALASLPGGGRDIEVDVPETLPRVAADAALLERAIANVVANARSWSPPGQPVQILGSSAAGRVELRVVDRGPGIPVAERRRVFEPFQRLGDRPAGDGVGLGLAVARGFVEAMGGELAIEETPGGGLTMVLAFGTTA